MKIVAVRTMPLSSPCERPYLSASGPQLTRHALVVEVETDAGVVGIGEAGSAGGSLASTQVVIERQLAPLLLGEDPLLIERLWQKMFVRTRQHGRRGIVMHAISGVDIALWDLAGKVAGLPLFRLLGAFRDRVEAYASGGFYREGKDATALAAEMAGYVGRGYQGVKMKIGRNPSTQSIQGEMLALREVCVVSLEEDLARVEAVRKAIGPAAKLMLDVNCAWSPALAIEMGRALEPYRPYWLEEPVATDDRRGSAEVARALATPVAGYETEVGLYGFRDLLAQDAVDIVQPDVTWSGGYTDCRRIAALAHAHHRMVAPHVFGSAVTLAASLHFLASIPNGLALEMDENPNPLREALLTEPIAIDPDGSVRLPERPGLGVSLDPAALERYRADP